MGYLIRYENTNPDNGCKLKSLPVLACGVLCMFSLLTACTDELLSPDKPVPDSSELVLVDLPGVMGLNLTESSGTDNAVNVVLGGSYRDGLRQEYALAAPDGDEKYHYLIFYRKSDSSNPLIFPIDPNDSQNDQTGDRNNLTLTVSRMFYAGKEDDELTGKEVFGGFSSKSQFVSFLNDVDAYVLLNFKLTETNHSLGTTGPVSGDNTVQKLRHLTKSDLESLRMKDYSVKANPISTGGESAASSTEQDFFIMANSVFAYNNAKKLDCTIVPNNVWESEAEARLYPAITMHVDRLASKVRVNFNKDRMAEAAKHFDPYGEDKYNKQTVNGVDINTVTGLPVMDMEVYKVNMEKYPDGIEFNEDGYKIQTKQIKAQLRIIGFGVSNLEQEGFLFKDINPTLSYNNWAWNDPNNHRSYWARDPHYQLVRASSSPFTKAEGYLHQFRQALDTDSVSSYHVGLNGGYEYGDNYVDSDLYDEYTVGGVTYRNYKTLGKINSNATISNAYLKYRSFGTLMDDFKKLKFSQSTTNGEVKYDFDPLYCLENTYYDPGMLNSSNWVWRWQRAPYSAATNLIVMAEIAMEGNPKASTVYLGQNNIFYLKKVNLLKSKLAILNQVMLSGGNAGIQILDGLWDQHVTPTGNVTHLDKIAWNEGSKLWFAEVETETIDGNEVPKFEEAKDEKGEVITDDEGNPTYKVKLKETWLASIDNGENVNEDELDLDLIPAEISGGDGQCLIAPSQQYMGMKYRYYLAPEKSDGSMDEKMAVEISYNHLVALIHKIIGPVDVYTDGKMYFSVPIPHNVESFGANSNKNLLNGLANFGVVRNTWYEITVNEITRLGTPVHVLEQPIVPVMDVKRSYINLGVDVKEWHEIEQEEIPMM